MLFFLYDIISCDVIKFKNLHDNFEALLLNCGYAPVPNLIMFLYKINVCLNLKINFVLLLSDVLLNISTTNIEKFASMLLSQR